MTDDKALADRIEALMPVAARLFDDLAARTGDGVGITRASYGPGEQAAFDLLKTAAQELGFAPAPDAAGNLIVRLDGTAPGGAGVVTGSHLDSVPVGGNFDGAAGAVAALIALAALRDTRGPHAEHITAMGIRGEETAWFSIHHIGSRAALGLLPAEEIATARRFDSGHTLERHMAETGCDLDALRRGEPTWPPAEIRAFLELHIEQGPVLVERNRPTGIVSGIRGNMRARTARCLGAYAHSGAVPRDMRQDALLAAAEFATRAEAEWERLLHQGRDLVLTFGKFHTDPAQHSHNKVPGEVLFSIDARSIEAETLDHVEATLTALAAEISARRGVTLDLGPIRRTRPAVMDAGLRAALRDGATRLGVDAMDIASGGGHDAGDFANAGVPSAMVFVRNPNGSHNPDEAMALEDFCEGTKLLAAGLSAAASPPS